METVTISPKYQIVIPKSIRDNLDLHPGEKIQVLVYSGRIEYIPVKSTANLKGFLKGMNTRLDRDGDRL
jgi:AbrB family looped-hinge helix DNA binding protein